MEKQDIEKMIRGILQIGTSHPDSNLVILLSERFFKELPSKVEHTERRKDEILKDCFGKIYQGDTLHNWIDFKKISPAYKKLFKIYDIIYSALFCLTEDKLKKEIDELKSANEKLDKLIPEDFYNGSSYHVRMDLLIHNYIELRQLQSPI